MEAGWDAAFPPRGGCWRRMALTDTGPGRLFARGSHRAVGLTSLAAAGGNILSEWWIDYAEGSVPASQEARAE